MGIALLKKAACGASLLLMSGCGSLMKNISDSYVGYLTTGQTSIDIVAKVDMASVTSKKALDVDLLNKQSGQALYKLHFYLDGDALVLSSNLFSQQGNIRLARKRDVCAAGSAPGFSSIEACLSDSAITIRAVKIGANAPSVFLFLSGDRAGAFNVEPIANKTYTLDELVSRVKTSNFDTMLKAQRVFQARQSIQVARGNLLPRLNMATALQLAQSIIDPSNILGPAIADVIPFVFPNRWYDLKRAGLTYEAERYSYAALVANQVNILEGLYFDVLNDQAYIDRLDRYRAYLTELTDFAKNQEEASRATPQASLLLRNRVIAVESDIADYRELLTKQFAAMAVAVGLSPNEGISSLASMNLPSISNSRIDANDFVATALASSFEVKELLYLERAAKKRFGVIKYSFLDPQADPQYSLGFGYAANLNIQSSNVREVQIRTLSTRATIEEQLKNIAASLNRISEQNTVIGEAAINAKRLIEIEILKMQRQGMVSAEALIINVDSLLKYELQQAKLQSAYMTGLANLNRLTLSGYYSDIGAIDPSLPANAPENLPIAR